MNFAPIFADINQILSYIKWDYFFIILAVFALIGALACLIRGIYRSTTRYIAEGILIIVLIFTMNPLVNLVSGIDIGGMFHIGNINISGTVIQVTTVDVTLQKILAAYFNLSTATSPQLNNSVMALSHAVIGLALFIVGMLLIILILAPLLGLAFYALSFCLFLPKETRKTKKHRLVSFFVGLVCSIVIGTIFISPLSSVVNSASNVAVAVNKADAKTKANLKNYQAYIDLLASYQDSAFFKTMTFGSGNPDNALDSKIMGQVSTSTINGVTFAFNDFVKAVGDIINVALPAVSIGETTTIDFSILLQKETFNTIFSKISQWQFLTAILPALAQYGINSADPNGDLGINIAGADFEGAINNIDDVFNYMYDGIISPTVKANEGKDFSNFQDLVITYDYKYKENVKSGIKILKDSSVLASISPLLIKSLVKSNETGFFKFDQKTFNLSHFLGDLDNLVEFIFDALRAMGKSTLKISEMSSLIDDILQFTTTSIDNYNKVIRPLIVGGNIELPADSKLGLPAETITNFSGMLGLNLLSTDYVDYSALVTTLTSSSETSGAIGQYITNETMDKVGAKLNTLDADGRKLEFGKVLDAYYEMAKLKESGVDLNHLDLENPTHVNAIKSMISKLDGSSFAEMIIPDVARKIFADAGASDMLYGLSIDDFNLHPVDAAGKSILIPELVKVFDLTSDAYAVSKVLSKTSQTTKQILDSLDESTRNGIKKVLNGIYDSKILNPERKINGKEGDDSLAKNVNFNFIVTNLFKLESLQDLGFVVPSDLSSIDWKDEVNDNGVVTKKGEISRIVDGLKIFNENSEILASDSISLDSLAQGDLVSNLFATLGSSKLFQPSLGPILDSKVAANLKTQFGINVSFAHIVDWEQEGINFQKVVKNISAASSAGQIQWDSLTNDQINSLLVSLAKTDMLSVQVDDNGLYVDKFGEMVFNLLDKAGLSAEVLGNSLSKSDFSIVENNQTGSLKPSFNCWYGTLSDAGLDTNGEIYSFANAFDNAVALKDMDGGQIDTVKLKPLLIDINNSNVLRKSISSVLSHFFGKMDPVSLPGGNQVSFTKINTSYFDTFTKAEAEEEITDICNLVDLITNKDENGKTILDRLGDLSTGKLPYGFSSEIAQLLNSIREVQMMIVPKGSEVTSFFTDVLSGIYNFITLDNMIYNSPDAKIQMSAFIQKMSDSSWSGTEGEVNRICSMIQVLEPTSIDADDGIKVSDLTDGDKLKDIDKTRLKALLNSINSCRTIHGAVPSLMDKLFTQMDINSLTSPRNINCKVYTDSSDESILWWENEINQFITLYQNLEDLGLGTDISSLDLTASNDSLSKIIVPIDKMNLFNDTKAYLVAHFIDSNNGSSVTLSDYIRDLNTSSYQTTSPKAERISQILFTPGHSEEELTEQLNLVQKFIATMTNATSIDFSTGGSGVTEVAFNLIMKTMDITYNQTTSKAEYVRSYLASELISNLLVIKLQEGATTPASKAKIEASIKEIMFSSTGADYYGLNILEARGLQGVPTLTTLPVYDKDDHAEFDTIVINAFTLMGRNTTGVDAYSSSVENYQAYNYMVNNLEAQYKAASVYNINNSVIASTLFDIYGKQAEIYEDNLGNKHNVIETIALYNSWIDTYQSLPDYAKLAIDAQLSTLGITSITSEDKIKYDSTNGAYESFESIGNKVVKALTVLSNITI